MATVMFGCLKAARVLHDQLLNSVLHLPMSFFDTNPSGRIINRFSKEVDVLDSVMPGVTRATIYGFVMVSGTFFTLFYLLKPVKFFRRCCNFGRVLPKPVANTLKNFSLCSAIFRCFRQFSALNGTDVLNMLVHNGRGFASFF